MRAWPAPLPGRAVADLGGLVTERVRAELARPRPAAHAGAGPARWRRRRRAVAAAVGRGRAGHRRGHRRHRRPAHRAAGRPHRLRRARARPGAWACSTPPSAARPSTPPTRSSPSWPAARGRHADRRRAPRTTPPPAPPTCWRSASARRRRRRHQRQRPHALRARRAAGGPDGGGRSPSGLSCQPGLALSPPPPTTPSRSSVGPEVIAGSTRLKAGAAQKLVLNTISTVVMVRLGRTYGNLMVDVRAGSEKLVDRARRIVVTAAGVHPGRGRGRPRSAPTAK